MELRQLKNFYTVAKAGNLTQAAIELNISQPALSISIKKLEEELGIKLFRRDTYRITLSDEGHRILPLAEKVLLSIHEIESTSKDIKSGSSELKIRAEAAQPLVVDAISLFKQKYPETAIRMIHEEECFDRPDIIIEASTSINESEYFQSTNEMIVFKEDLLVAIPRILNPVAESPVTLDYILDNELIGLSKKYALGNIEEYYCSRFNLNLRHSIICDNPSILLNLLMNGSGIAFVPSVSWLFKDNPAIKLVPFEIPGWSRYIKIHATEYRASNDAKFKFMEVMNSRIERLLGPHPWY